MPHNLMDKRVLHICHVDIVRHTDCYFDSQRIKAASSSCAGCTGNAATSSSVRISRKVYGAALPTQFTRFCHRIVHGLLPAPPIFVGHLGVDACNVIVGHEWGVSLASGDNIAVLHILLLSSARLSSGVSPLPSNPKVVAHLSNPLRTPGTKRVIVAVASSMPLACRGCFSIVNEFGFSSRVSTCLSCPA